ncbi:MAG: cation:proton antiporter [Kiritimatiellae bacterium]|nr:cation:proton antiporter [Kiritimatiellia bacterium]
MKKGYRLFWLLSAVFLLAVPAFAGEVAPGTGAGQQTLTEKMLFLALQVGCIMFVAKLGGMFATKLRMPSVLGELASGIAIGPYALGGLGFGSGVFSHGVFPLPAAGSGVPVTPELYGLCTIASVILLFLSGIETNLKMFLRYAFAGSMIGVGGVLASFFLGDLCAVYLLPKLVPSFANETLSIFHPAALFMGIMSTATSVGITARILSERKVMDSAEGVSTMAAAVIDDVLGIIVLAIGMGIIQAKGATGSGGAVNWGPIGKIAAQAFGIWLGGTVIGILAARRISWLLKLFKSPLAVATLAFGLSLIVAGFFEAMGLTLIIGAYVMGLALSRTDIRYVVQENLQSVYTFLVPVFFCVMGMMVDCHQLISKPVLIFGGIYTLLAVAAKVIGCSVPALFCGFNTLGSLRIGAGMIPRGEVALIIAGIGLSSGYLTSEIFGIGILMTLVTTVVAPPCLVGLFDVKRGGVRNQESDRRKDSAPLSFAMPTESAATLMMENLIKVFRSQGFFTSLLNPDEDIWQVSRNETEITCSRKGNKLIFECQPEDRQFIAMAINEVVASLNTLAHDLAQPIKTGQIATMIKPKKNEIVPPHKDEAVRLIHQFLYLPNLKVSSFRELINVMTGEMYKKGLIRNLDRSRAAIQEREHGQSTGLQHGIAVPHGRTDAVEKLVGAVATIGSPDGVPGYETMDHLPVRVVILTISPVAAAGPYLRVQAYLSALLTNPSTSAEKFVSCTTPESMRQFLVG